MAPGAHGELGGHGRLADADPGAPHACRACMSGCGRGRAGERCARAPLLVAVSGHEAKFSRRPHRSILIRVDARPPQYHQTFASVARGCLLRPQSLAAVHARTC